MSIFEIFKPLVHMIFSTHLNSDCMRKVYMLQILNLTKRIVFEIMTHCSYSQIVRRQNIDDIVFFIYKDWYISAIEHIYLRIFGRIIV